MKCTPKAVIAYLETLDERCGVPALAGISVMVRRFCYILCGTCSSKITQVTGYDSIHGALKTVVDLQAFWAEFCNPLNWGQICFTSGVDLHDA